MSDQFRVEPRICFSQNTLTMTGKEEELLSALADAIGVYYNATGTVDCFSPAAGANNESAIDAANWNWQVSNMFVNPVVLRLDCSSRPLFVVALLKYVLCPTSRTAACVSEKNSLVCLSAFSSLVNNNKRWGKRQVQGLTITFRVCLPLLFRRRAPKCRCRCQPTAFETCSGARRGTR